MNCISYTLFNGRPTAFLPRPYGPGPLIPRQTIHRPEERPWPVQPLVLRVCPEFARLVFDIPQSGPGGFPPRKRYNVPKNPGQCHRYGRSTGQCSRNLQSILETSFLGPHGDPLGPWPGSGRNSHCLCPCPCSIVSQGQRNQIKAGFPVNKG